MKTKARDLELGDQFFLSVFGEVVEIEPVADGRRIRVRFALEDQGQSATLMGRGAWIAAAFGDATPDSDTPKRPALEFTAAGCVLEFLSPPGRGFHVRNRDDDGGDNDEVDPDPTGGSPVLIDAGD